MASKISFEVDAVVRHDMGKGASRRLRREEKVPGVVYGAGKPAVSLSLEHNKIAKSLSVEAFYSHILTLKTGTDAERVILKAVQRHPYKPRILHVDFQRVRADEKIHMHVPVHFIGESEAPGVKEGGVVSHILSDVEVSCLPDNLPEFLEIDISALAMNQTLHISDIKLPQGVELIALSHEDDKPLVSIHMPRIEEEPVAEETVDAGDVPTTAQKGEGEEGADAAEGESESK